MKRFIFLTVCAVMVLLVAWGTTSTAGAADKYPDRPIDVIVPWGVGGGSDLFVRAIAVPVQKILGVSLAISNVPGASGSTGIVKLLGAKADGYTIANFTAGMGATMASGIAPYKFTDLIFLVRNQVVPSYLFVNSEDTRFKTWKDLETHARQNPGKVNVATSGLGTQDEIALRYFDEIGIKMNMVPYAKPGERYASLIGRHEDVLYEEAGDVYQYLEAKQIRPLLVFWEKRIPDFPDVPCAVELGYPLTLTQWRCMVVKAGTPPDRQKILADAFLKAMETQEWKDFSKTQRQVPESAMGPKEFGPWAEQDIQTIKDRMSKYGMLQKK